MKKRAPVGRRAVVAAMGGALGACAVPGTRSAVQEQVVAPAVLPEPIAAPAAPAPPASPAPVEVVAPPPAPQPSVLDLGLEGIVQPTWAAEGDRVLFYDRPQPGEDGLWSIDPVSGKLTRERPQFGSLAARGTLLVTPRPAQRDTYVLHLPSGREWAFPTSNGILFSPDGTMAAYNATTQQGGGGGTFQLTTLTVSWADGQNAQRIPLPLNASAVAWLPGKDGSPNGRLLLSGRRSRQDHPALWLLDVRDRSLADLVRSRRLVGVLASPAGTWVAYVAMWNQDASQDGLWVMRTDGSDRRKLDFVGGYRWTADDRLIVLPTRSAAGESHEVWEVTPGNGEHRRLTDPAVTPFRVANYDWEISPDGTNLVYVSAGTRRLANLSLPKGLQPVPGAAPAGLPAHVGPGGGKPYGLPFATPPGPSTWYVANWYGITLNGYRGRNSVYREGQGIHFGIDFAAPMGTPLVAMAPGRVIAIDGGYGSPPHNLVLQFADGNQAMYGHVIERSRHVQVGQLVEAGQVVANTGDSSNPYDGFGNPHVHLEIRKGGASVATNPTPFVDYNWDDLGLGVYPGPRFERDLDNHKKHQFLDDQPDIRFGGPIITNFARPWPP
jgi:murein DD-endopeptidase MepM/ murein hydrolase activator NlpD